MRGRWFRGQDWIAWFTWRYLSVNNFILYHQYCLRVNFTGVMHFRYFSSSRCKCKGLDVNWVLKKLSYLSFRWRWVLPRFDIMRTWCYLCVTSLILHSLYHLRVKTCHVFTMNLLYVILSCSSMILDANWERSISSRWINLSGRCSCKMWSRNCMTLSIREYDQYCPMVSWHMLLFQVHVAKVCAKIWMSIGKGYHWINLRRPWFWQDVLT